ncbi:2668_t:CDS:1, partial [Gigaspora margarita]
MSNKSIRIFKESGSFIKNQFIVETPLFPKDGIEERNGLIMLSKKSAVQE